MIILIIIYVIGVILFPAVVHADYMEGSPPKDVSKLTNGDYVILAAMTIFWPLVVTGIILANLWVMVVYEPIRKFIKYQYQPGKVMDKLKGIGKDE